MNLRTTVKRTALAGAIAAFVAANATVSNAGIIYWDNGVGVSPGVYGNTVNWDTLADGTGGDPGAIPGATDIASFNVSPLNTAQTISLQANQVVQGLQFPSSGDVQIQSNSNSRILTIGADGISKTGTTGNVVVSPTTSGIRFALLLSDSQTWSNDSTSGTVIVRSGANNVIQATSAGTTTLTLAGSNTGINQIGSQLTNGSGGGTVAVVKNGPGTWVYTGGAAATYTGGLTVNQGIYAIGATTNANGIGAGPVTLNGGTISGYLTNQTTAFNLAPTINVTADSTIRATRLDQTAGLNFTFINSSFTSTGTPGNGPVLTFGRGSNTVSQILTITTNATINNFNGTLRFELATANSAITFSPTTVNGNDGSNAKFVFDTPGGANVGSTRFDFFNQPDPTIALKMGELSGSGFLSFRGTSIASPYVMQVGNLNTNSVFAGNIRNFAPATNGILNFKKIGTGSITLSGDNDYTGGTTITNGTVVAGADALLATFMPADQVGQNVAVVANVYTTRDAADAPMNHGFTDHQRIVPVRGYAAADQPNVSQKPLYVKVLSPTTFELYTDPALTTLQTVTTDVTAAASGVKFTMTSSLGAETATSPNRVVQLGDGTGGAVSLLAGTATNPNVVIAREINVAAGGGTPTFGSSVNGNSVFSGAITLNQNTDLASVSVGGNALSVSGAVGGTGGLAKVGVGKAIMSNINNTYGGVTSVTDGILLVNGNNTGNGAYSVASGATLGGTGSVGASSVTVALGGFLSPGASIESFDVGGADGFGTLAIEYDGDAGSDLIDVLNVAGIFDISNMTVDFDLLPLGDALDDSAIVFATYGSLTGSSFLNAIDTPVGYNIVTGYNGNNIALVAIPEPSTMLLGAIGALGLCVAGVRRRKK